MPDAAKTIKIRATGTFGVANWANIHYMQYTGGPPTAAGLTALADLWATTWQTRFAAHLSSASILTQVDCVDLNSVSGETATMSTSKAGGTSGGAMPASVAVCVSKKIARRYRGGHPRFYLCGIPVTAGADSKSLSTTYVNAINSDLAASFTALNAFTHASITTCKLANVSYYYTVPPANGSVLRATPVVDLVSSWAVNARLDSQRRRLD